MARKKKAANEYSGKNWREGDLIHTFQLQRNNTEYTELMKAWLNVSEPPLDAMETVLFNRILLKAQKNIASWTEEDLKMKFIAIVLELAHFTDDDKIIGFFDKIISAEVEGIPLTVKSDFMYAQGTFDVFRTPYFHFQEYKPHKQPSGDSMAQLIEAFLIAQVKNKNNKPLYGVEIVGAYWKFVIMEGKNYCISNAYDCIKKQDLQSIIAILRHFRVILYEQLIDV
jgi:hypothetical protein